MTLELPPQYQVLLKPPEGMDFSQVDIPMKALASLVGETVTEGRDRREVGRIIHARRDPRGIVATIEGRRAEGNFTYRAMVLDDNNQVQEMMLQGEVLPRTRREQA